MKQIFTQYAAYNLWANTQFAETISGLTPSYFDKEIESSFPSIRETINHIRGAESIWLNRLQGTPLQAWPKPNTTEKPQEAADAWLKGSEALATHVDGLEEGAFATPMDYLDMRGNARQDKLSDVLLHTFNHSTFHRGQLVTLFRQSGIQSIPRTDYIAYCRGVANVK